MAREEYRVLGQKVGQPQDPNVPFASHEYYAKIAFSCEDGVKLVVRFLRPDTKWAVGSGLQYENSHDPTSKTTTIYLRSYQFAGFMNKLTSGQPLVVTVDPDHPSAASVRIASSQEPIPVGSGPPPSLAQWLADNSRYRRIIKWVDLEGNTIFYPDWSAQQKLELEHAFNLAWLGSSIPGLTDPPNNLFTGGTKLLVVLSADDAWNLYIAHVAHCLAVEIAEAVPWSIAEYGLDESDRRLQILLDQTEIIGAWNHATGTPWNGYSYYSGVLPAPPDIPYRFLRTNNLIAYNRLETISRVLDWCRDNLSHYAGPYPTPAEQYEAHWQYAIPPLSRILSGTYLKGDPDGRLRHFTAGCHGTANFLKTLLRVINIPVTPCGAATHTGVHFVSENLYMLHGDDPYGSPGKITPPIPGKELLVDEAVYHAWITNETDPYIRFGNPGRRAKELAIKYLPDNLLHAKYLDDMSGPPANPDGDPYVDSRVFDFFVVRYPNDPYHMYDLDTLRYGTITMADGTQIQCDLWNRLEVKLQEYGKSGPLKPFTFQPLHDASQGFFDFVKDLFSVTWKVATFVVQTLTSFFRGNKR